MYIDAPVSITWLMAVRANNETISAGKISGIVGPGSLLFIILLIMASFGRQARGPEIFHTLCQDPVSPPIGHRVSAALIVRDLILWISLYLIIL